MIGRKARDTTDDLLAHPLDSKRQAGRPAALFFAGGTLSVIVLDLVAAAAYARPRPAPPFRLALARASTQKKSDLLEVFTTVSTSVRLPP